ncbi:MAG: hypothetical protein M1838_002202 [Thelocarpon superellum]|nr:MAG: hypothetical protein M1838_002202 [Thelocarpon superellum]
MASTLPYRQSPNGAAPLDSGPVHRTTSLSSFPNSRTPSSMSLSRPRAGSRAPNPPLFEPYRSSDGSSKTPSSAVSSLHSSTLSMRAPALNGSRKKRRRLRSQYPRDGEENHVEYILVAAFHIDRGPIMEHQYPGAISGDEHMLAELMLPDQAHVRNQDWTIFFLHKDATPDDDSGDEHEGKTSNGPDDDGAESRGARPEHDDRDDAGPRRERDDGEDDHDDDEAEGGEGPPLIYVLNLVNTKQDTTAKRGAVVKAMAICTRHSFLHIYKPLLLLALEEYFRSPYPETLKSLYDAVNSMDLSLMPRLNVLERQILQSSDTKDMFVEKFEQMIRQRMAETQKDESADTEPRKIGDGSPTPSQPTYIVPRDTHEFETRVVYNGIPIPIKVPTAVSPETVGDFSLIKLIQAFSGPHSKDAQPFMLHSHLTTGGAYTHPVIVLVNAMLTQKRVIFLGHNRPSGEVAEAVLAACALASGGVLRGFTRHAFPYTDLSKIDDLLKVPGFIAGVTNPAFANHPEWWDLLCDIPTGRMKISNRIEAAPVTEGLVNFQQQNALHSSASSTPFGSNTNDATGDQAFMDDILRSIASRHGEAVIRAKWRDWVVKFTRIAAAFEESVYGASALYIGGEESDASGNGVNGHGYVWSDENARQRELAGAVNRIEGWRNTRSYYSFIQDLAQLYNARPIKTIDLHHLHDLLRTRKLSTAHSGAIFNVLASQVTTPAAVNQLLTVTPESHAGLFYIALGLFHPDKAVREAVVGLLERIRESEAGRHFWAGVGRFAKLAFFRLRDSSADGAAKPAVVTLGAVSHPDVDTGGTAGAPVTTSATLTTMATTTSPLTGLGTGPKGIGISMGGGGGGIGIGGGIGAGGSTSSIATAASTSTSMSTAAAATAGGAGTGTGAVAGGQGTAAAAAAAGSPATRS